MVMKRLCTACEKVVPKPIVCSYTKTPGWAVKPMTTLELRRGRRKLYAYGETTELWLATLTQKVEEVAYDDSEFERKVAETIGKHFNLYFSTHWMIDPPEKPKKKGK